jgi:hypothetical protein
MKILNLVIAVVIVAAFTFSIASSSTSSNIAIQERVVLQGEDGSRQLVYDANNFRPQAETTEDVNILVHAANETLREAGNNRHFVTVRNC